MPAGRYFVERLSLSRDYVFWMLVISELTKEQVILWAAGFYEGEGYVNRNQVRIAQVNKYPLELILKYFGGSIHYREAKIDLNKQCCYEWYLGGQEARDFIDNIYSILSPRRQQQIDNIFLTNYIYNRCKKGHLFNAVKKDAQRYCRTCKSAASLISYHRNRHLDHK